MGAALRRQRGRRHRQWQHLDPVRVRVTNQGLSVLFTARVKQFETPGMGIY